MRQAGIPTSQQPVTKIKNNSGWEYEYEVPKDGGGTKKMVVQQQTMDRSHTGNPHWEAGDIKLNGKKGRKNKYDRHLLINENKTKAFYKIPDKAC